MPSEYPSPVNTLLTYGDCRNFKEWPDYLELGLTKEHIPELIRMISDDDLHWAEQNTLAVWAPVHAWRALGQLQAEEAVMPLIELCEAHEDDDEWMFEEMPTVFKIMGPNILPVLMQYVTEHSAEYATVRMIADSINQIAEQYPEVREQCIRFFIETLQHYNKNDPELNGLLIWFLMDFKITDALPVIREAFENEYVDYSLVGDFEDVEIKMSVRTERSTPGDHPGLMDKYPGLRRPPKAKIGRNDPCPCGSGKKYKKCCLNNPEGQMLTEYLAMFSTKKIKISAQKKAELIELVAHRSKFEEAEKQVKQMTGADTRLVKDYVRRLLWQ